MLLPVVFPLHIIHYLENLLFLYLFDHFFLKKCKHLKKTSHFKSLVLNGSSEQCFLPTVHKRRGGGWSLELLGLLEQLRIHHEEASNAALR